MVAIAKQSGLKWDEIKNKEREKQHFKQVENLKYHSNINMSGLTFMRYGNDNNNEIKKTQRSAYENCVRKPSLHLIGRQQNHFHQRDWSKLSIQFHHFLIHSIGFCIAEFHRNHEKIGIIHRGSILGYKAYYHLTVPNAFNKKKIELRATNIQNEWFFIRMSKRLYQFNELRW